MIEKTLQNIWTVSRLSIIVSVIMYNDAAATLNQGVSPEDINQLRGYLETEYLVFSFSRVR